MGRQLILVTKYSGQIKMYHLNEQILRLLPNRLIYEFQKTCSKISYFNDFIDKN